MKQRNLASLLLAGAMTAALLTGPAQAAESPSPQEIAATRLQAEGLMNGDEHGDLHLDKGLTRAELACLISPIVLNPEHVAWERDYYAKLCTTNFSDVPEWAQVAVGVCASSQPCCPASMRLLGENGDHSFQRCFGKCYPASQDPQLCKGQPVRSRRYQRR